MKEFQVGDKIVFCPYSQATRHRGATGTVIGRTVKGSKGKKKLKAILVKWDSYRSGVSNITLRGKPDKRNFKVTFEGEAYYVRRPEVGHDSIHPARHCDDCPLRLSRLIKTCPYMTTKEQEQKAKQARSD